MGKEHVPTNPPQACPQLIEEMLHRAHAELTQQRFILLRLRIAGGQQFLAVENRIRSRKKT
jgi:hypothetical protein